MIGRLGLRDRILLMFTGSGIVFPALVVMISYLGARDMLAEQAFEKLTNVREQRAQQLEVYFRGIEDHRLAKDFSQLGRITSELRNTTMSLRMVPLRQTFQIIIRYYLAWLVWIRNHAVDSDRAEFGVRPSSDVLGTRCRAES